MSRHKQPHKGSRRPSAPVLYALYEASVQASEAEVEVLEQVYTAMSGGRKALSLREDFCGTFQNSCEWVLRGPKRTALGLDLDESPLAYGREHRLAALPEAARERIEILRQDVISKTRPVDLVAASNFSFFIFKERATLLRYFRAVRASLKPGGVFMADMAGGPEFETVQEETSRRTLKGVGPFTYVWELKRFDPVRRDAHYAIHFRFKGRPTIQDAFTYDWRLWTLPEVRDVLLEAGFSEVRVFMEDEDSRGRDTGRWSAREKAEPDECWIAYIAARK